MMSRHSEKTFDIAFVGHYTKDTIIYPHATRVVDGGAFNYGANVAVRMGLRTAVVTRLARADWHVIEGLERLGVTAFARATEHSTLLNLIYPTANLDERTIAYVSSAGPFTVAEVAGLQARAFVIGASVRGEVPTTVVETLAARGGLLALDAQGFLRVVRSRRGDALLPESAASPDLSSDAPPLLEPDDWPGREAVLKHVTVFKADAVEASLLTGESDRYRAAASLAGYGPAEVLLTHNGGVMVYHDGIFHEAPFVPQALRGRSGRGDTCTAAYLGRRLTAPPEDAVVWAAAVTSLKLEREGVFQRDMAEVEALYRDLRGRRLAS